MIKGNIMEFTFLSSPIGAAPGFFSGGAVLPNAETQERCGLVGLYRIIYY